MTTFEIRMTNETTMTNGEGPGGPGAKRWSWLALAIIRHCLFVIHWSFGFRHSSSRTSRLLLPIALVALAFASGCAIITFSSHKQTQRDVYMHLMTPLEQAKFLYLEASDKPLSIQLAYLQEIGVYQKWVDVPKNKQEAILRREVKEGMTPLQVQMAWGRPGEERDETLPADRAEGHTKTVWDYGVRAQKVGGSGHERSVCFFDDRVLWVRQFR